MYEPLPGQQQALEVRGSQLASKWCATAYKIASHQDIVQPPHQPYVLG